MRRDILAAIVVAIAAVLPRIVILAATTDSTVFADMVDYYDRARYLHDHGRLYPDAFRVPFYPMTIAGAFVAFGQSFLAARIWQCLVFALMAAATYALASRITTRSRAMIAGLVVAWYPGLLLYTVYVVSEPLFMLLSVLAVLAAQYGPSLRWMVAAGVLAGLATLTRQAGVALSAALISWAGLRAVGTWRWRGDGRRRTTLAAAVALGVVLVVTPWAVRNYLLFGRVMALETTSGITFLMAQYEDATGRYLLTDWVTVLERYLNRQPDEFSRSAEGYRLGMQYIVNDPGRILTLVPRRLGYLFDLESREHLWLYTNGYFGPRSAALVRGFGWVMVASFPLLAAAAVLSLAFGPPLRTHTEVLIGWVLAVMIVQLLTIYGDPRFHLPLVPFLAVLAVRPWWRTPNRSWIRVGVGVVVLVAGLAWWGSRLPDQLHALDRAASPNGWQSAATY